FVFFAPPRAARELPAARLFRAAAPVRGVARFRVEAGRAALFPAAFRVVFRPAVLRVAVLRAAVLRAAVLRVDFLAPADVRAPAGFEAAPRVRAAVLRPAERRATGRFFAV